MIEIFCVLNRLIYAFPHNPKSMRWNWNLSHKVGFYMDVMFPKKKVSRSFLANLSKVVGMPITMCDSQLKHETTRVPYSSSF